MNSCLLLGLGNPDANHSATRHNVGFDTVNAIAENESAIFTSKYSGSLAVVEIVSTKIYLFKPLTYMNKSGEPLKQLLKYHSVGNDLDKYTSEKSKTMNNQAESIDKAQSQDKIRNIFVFYDDLDLNLGKIKVRYNKGSHNGLRSINSNIGENYHKIGIGISRPNDREDVGDYVLTRFNKADREIIDNTIAKIVTAIPFLIEKGIGEFLKSCV
jgi:PTH1 family peptidyl-tRNA hydrolase